MQMWGVSGRNSSNMPLQAASINCTAVPVPPVGWAKHNETAAASPCNYWMAGACLASLAPHHSYLSWDPRNEATVIWQGIWLVHVHAMYLWVALMLSLREHYQGPTDPPPTIHTSVKNSCDLRDRIHLSAQELPCQQTRPPTALPQWPNCQYPAAAAAATATATAAGSSRQQQQAAAEAEAAAAAGSSSSSSNSVSMSRLTCILAGQGMQSRGRRKLGWCMRMLPKAPCTCNMCIWCSCVIGKVQ